MPPGSDQPAWEWRVSHTQWHLLPGIAAMIGGGLLWARTRPPLLGGATLALLAGISFGRGSAVQVAVVATPRP